MRHWTGQILVSFTLAVMLHSAAFAATKTQVIYSFSGSNDGGNPASDLIFDDAGNAYGTTVSGGNFGYGTVFQLTPSNGGWQEQVLYSFTGFADGKNPHGGVRMDGAGNLYGTTVAGGDGICTGDGCGVVYTLTKSGSTYTQSVIHSFTDDGKGFGPGGAVVFDQKGNLYGMTPDGGAFEEGTIYQLKPGQGGVWKHKVIHNFTGKKDGAVGSLGPLLVDSTGNLFGVTELGGGRQAGNVFEMTHNPDGTWTLTPIYTFKGMPDAAFPYGGLISDAAGALYGTTYYGGANGLGSVFKLAKNKMGNWKEEVVYSFQGGRDGSLTTTTLALDPSGKLYGTTSEGGNAGCSCGTIFRLKFANGVWTESVVHRFQSVPDGAYAYYGLTLNGSSFFGATVQGGVHNQGAIFQYTP